MEMVLAVVRVTEAEWFVEPLLWRDYYEDCFCSVQRKQSPGIVKVNSAFLFGFNLPNYSNFVNFPFIRQTLVQIF